MKKKSAVLNIIVALAAAAVFILGGLVASRFLEKGLVDEGRAFSYFYMAFLLFICLGLVLGLRKSLKRTLYSYDAVGLVGGILFLSILIITTLAETLLVREKTVAELFSSFLLFPRRFSYLAMAFMALVTLLVLVSNIALIRHEGRHLHNLLSIIFGVFYVGGSVALYFISDLVSRTFRDSVTPLAVMGVCIPLFLVIMLCYFECIFVGVSVLAFAAARKKPALDKDYIIILGCSIDKRGGLLPLLKQRTDKAVHFAWDQEIATGKPVYYVPSGGQGKNEVISEGSAMELYLLTHGAEANEVFPEKKSRNTAENMLFSKEIIDSLKPSAKIAFATTNFHVFRSGIIARELGLDAEGIGSSTKWYFWPNGFIREFFGILAMSKKKHLSVALAVLVFCILMGLAVCFLV